jgi:hypothetical protein
MEFSAGEVEWPKQILLLERTRAFLVTVVDRHDRF